jgi:MerR family transcriptional regulator, copper efflux regulator
MKPTEMMTIGLAAARSGVPPKTIRFYEEAGIIKPAARGENRYRAYGDADVHTLRFVIARDASASRSKTLQRSWTSTKRASRDVKKLALEHVAEIDRRIAELTGIRDTIGALAKQCRGDHRPECPILDDLVAATH